MSLRRLLKRTWYPCCMFLKQYSFRLSLKVLFKVIEMLCYSKKNFFSKFSNENLQYLQPYILFLISRFFDKTKNEFSDRKKFKKVQGKYDLVIIDYKTVEVRGRLFLLHMFRLYLSEYCLLEVLLWIYCCCSFFCWNWKYYDWRYPQHIRGRTLIKLFSLL